MNQLLAIEDCNIILRINGSSFTVFFQERIIVSCPYNSIGDNIINWRCNEDLFVMIIGINLFNNNILIFKNRTILYSNVNNYRDYQSTISNFMDNMCRLNDSVKSGFQNYRSTKKNAFNTLEIIIGIIVIAILGFYILSTHYLFFDEYFVSVTIGLCAIFLLPLPFELIKYKKTIKYLQKMEQVIDEINLTTAST